jgi:hypothetical protein
LPEPRRLDGVYGMGEAHSHESEVRAGLCPQIAVGREKTPTVKEFDDIQRGDRLTHADEHRPAIPPRPLHPLLKTLRVCAVNCDRRIEKDFHVYLYATECDALVGA